MSTNRCTRRGPETGAQCCKLANEHKEHHALLSGERWTDRDSDAQRTALDQRAAELRYWLDALRSRQWTL